MTKRIGIDLGGTKLEGIVLDEAGTIVERRRIPTPQEDYQETVRATCDLIRTLDEMTGENPSIGIGMPGSVSTLTGTMKNCNSTCLNGRFFGRDVAREIGRPVAIANDADCFALSEATDGAGAGANRVFGVILGTGVGGGIVEGKRLLTGPNGICGEWGHNRLPREARVIDGPARACFCGRDDCIETYLAGPGLSMTFATLSGSEIAPKQIAALADQGDPDALRSLDVYARQLAFALSQVINLLDPDVIVLGGGVSNIDRIHDDVPQHWAEHVFSDSIETRLMRPSYGDSSGVRGAAWLP